MVEADAGAFGVELAVLGLAMLGLAVTELAVPSAGEVFLELEPLSVRCIRS
jgi:hypothetical protein